MNTKIILKKTIKKLILKDGSICIDQQRILQEVANYYSNLFKSFDNQLTDINLEKLISDIPIRKLTKIESAYLEKPLTVSELGAALKDMKNNKTPGVDGFPAEFVKVFWKDLKFWICASVNFSFESGLLPASLRQCVITCLPKKDKARELIKNWRPLSMLSVIYKIVSSSLANRLKRHLNYLIDSSQNGFISGRYIGESTRLVYDIMDFTEKANITGQLMVIDFQKAFDSISWNFIYNTLSFLGFGESYIKWIKLLNNEVTARVIQSGYASNSIQIGRGCRQGDPISPYLYIIGGQILTVLILHNPDIKGIFIKGTEFKVTQYADDMTLFLDGSQSSILAALNSLEIFGTMSGLKMNKDKTKIIWIGRKRYSREKLLNTGLQWGLQEFEILGLKFSVHLDNIVSLNFNPKILEIKRMINNWEKRQLTPLGKITVIKTLLLSKINHLLISLPNPKPQTVKQIEELFSGFLWSDKPSKISKNIIMLSKVIGGLNMFNFTIFLKALKTTWFRRLILRPEAPWSKLFELIMNNTINNFILLGPEHFIKAKNMTTNNFWADVFESTHSILKNQRLLKNQHILTSPLWYNQKISEDPLFIPDWFNKGIHLVSDVVDEHGNFMSIRNLQILYNIEDINFLRYLKIKMDTLNFMKNSNF